VIGHSEVVRLVGWLDGWFCGVESSVVCYDESVGEALFLVGATMWVRILWVPILSFPPSPLSCTAYVCVGMSG